MCRSGAGQCSTPTLSHWKHLARGTARLFVKSGNVCLPLLHYTPNLSSDSQTNRQLHPDHLFLSWHVSWRRGTGEVSWSWWHLSWQTRKEGARRIVPEKHSGISQHEVPRKPGDGIPLWNLPSGVRWWEYQHLREAHPCGVGTAWRSTRDEKIEKSLGRTCCTRMKWVGWRDLDRSQRWEMKPSGFHRDAGRLGVDFWLVETELPGGVQQITKYPGFQRSRQNRVGDTDVGHGCMVVN